MQIAPGLQSRSGRGAEAGAGPSGIGPTHNNPRFSMTVNGEVNDIFWTDVCADPNAMNVAYYPWPTPLTPITSDSTNTISNISSHKFTHNASISSAASEPIFLHSDRDFGHAPNGRESPSSQTPSRRASIANTTPEPHLNSKLGTRSPRISISGQGAHGEPGLGPGGVAGFRKREGSVNSTHSRPSSTSSSKTNRAGAFFANAKQLFNHTPPSDRQGMAPDESSDDAQDLQLHMALSAGDICKLNEVLTSMSIELLTHRVLLVVANIIIGDVGSENGLDNILALETGRLEYAVCSDNMATIEDALNMARAGEVTITKNAWKYVNADAYPCSEPRRNCYILKNIQGPLINTPLLRRVRNDKLFSAPVESNPHYYK